jgi:hypothetical protein
MTDKKPITHTAYAMKREGRRMSRWLEIGVARLEMNGDGHHQVIIDRLPIGGFSGLIHLSPVGTKPPEPSAEPQRPSQSNNPEPEEDF